MEKIKEMEYMKQTKAQISFKPLLKLLVDNGMKTSELSKEAGIAPSTMTAIRAHQSVTLATVAKICTVLDCPIESVVEIVREE